MRIELLRLTALTLLLLVPQAACLREDVDEPQAYLLVLNKAENSATILDPVGGEVRATVVTGVAPHEAALSLESGLAVISNYGNQVNPGSSLTVVDLRKGRAVRTIGLRRFRRPHGLRMMSDGVRVLVTAEDSRALLVVNILDGEIEKAVPTNGNGSHMVAIGADGQTAYVANIGSGSVSVINLAESRLDKNLNLGEGVEGIDVSPDGKELWVANRLADKIYVIDTATQETVAEIPCASFPIRVRFTPDGAHVLVSNARSGDVAVFSASEKTEVRRIAMGVTAEEGQERMLDFDLSPVPVGIVVEPNGERAYVANSNADIVTVLDLKEWKVSGRLRAGEEPDGMVYWLYVPPAKEE